MVFRPTLAALLALTAAMALPSQPALAHDDAYLDTLTAPHGGQIRMAGPYHYELVLAKTDKTDPASPVTVFVTDHAGKPISTAGATASVTLLAGTSTTRSALQPAGANALQGQAAYTASPSLKAVVTVTLPGQPPQQARFTPWTSANPHPVH